MGRETGKEGGFKKYGIQMRLRVRRGGCFLLTDVQSGSKSSPGEVKLGGQGRGGSP